MSPIHSAILGLSLLASGIAVSSASIDPAREVDRRIDGAFVVATSATSAATAALAGSLRSARGDRLRPPAGGARTVTVEHRAGPADSSLVRVRVADVSRL